MNWVKFSVAVAVTSVALLVTGAVVAANALASGLPQTMMFAQRGDRGSWNLPPELASLKDVPADQRFSHFKGVQVSLTDKDGKPVAVTIVPGVASSVSANNVTLAGNDGASHTYSIDAQTLTHGQTLANGQNLVVVTMNNATTATAVFAAPAGDWGHH
ncbi:MAG TPA: hypothetical protein VGQ62_12260 [Chloroflexota bacterium]|nr:hypothetical protein [Chloroflexota bacterium]